MMASIRRIWLTALALVVLPADAGAQERVSIGLVSGLDVGTVAEWFPFQATEPAAVVGARLYRGTGGLMGVVDEARVDATLGEGFMLVSLSVTHEVLSSERFTPYVIGGVGSYVTDQGQVAVSVGGGSKVQIGGRTVFLEARGSMGGSRWRRDDLSVSVGLLW